MNTEAFIQVVIEGIDSGDINVDLGKTFIENGGYSLAAVRLADSVYSSTEVVLNFFDIMGELTLAELLRKLNDTVPSYEDSYQNIEEGVL